MIHTITALLLAVLFAEVNCQLGFRQCHGQNEEFSNCVPLCPKTCSTIREPAGICQDCTKGCNCKDGFVRDLTGICIPHSQCPPVAVNATKICSGRNEEYNFCGTICPDTCASIRNPKERPCIQDTFCGCICKPGFVRDVTGDCVPPSRCSSVRLPGRPTQRSTIKCNGPHEVFSNFGSACPKTCDSIGKPEDGCIKMFRSGCFCKGGFVRNREGVCVRPSECPPVCTGPNERFMECGVPCPLTCDTLINNRTDACPTVCTRGCFCNLDFLRNSDGVCVLPSECPEVPECSDPNEVFQLCGSPPCETCDTLGSGLLCKQECGSGCFCKAGLVRNSTGACVERSECPSEMVGLEEPTVIAGNPNEESPSPNVALVEVSSLSPFCRTRRWRRMRSRLSALRVGRHSVV